ncbi:molybdenum cofactor biosynthesis protein MoaE [Mobilicoccus caccae]|uniref:Molybdopterin biosynthesis protein MoeE n=1 Tax=Mobilicoccus caccae TaxID=1859295 RepID=A0ABQ6ILW0_9MICO|nr:molybdenum cofactor biosynthesis protein MoaE [Mobilicoccus caccae]GMA38907.1 molybdopterin biosynthesis protein MoeE [Mobilicoccus caccae]
MSQVPPLVAVSETPLSVDEVLRAVAHPRVGGVVTFLGVVRDHDGGKDVGALDYSAHPSALTALTELVEATLRREGVVTAAAVHRKGHLEIGDLAVVLAVGAEHRGQAFDACRALIDDLKAQVPIWKHQVFADGSDEWVGTP